MIWLGVAAFALVTATALALWAPGIAEVYGYPGLGPVVDAGLPLAHVTALGAAAVAAGGLWRAAVLVPGEPYGTVTAQGYRGLLSMRRAAAVLAVAAFLVGALTAAESVGTPPATYLTRPDLLLTGLGAVEPATGWVITGAVAAVVAVLAGAVLSWRGAVGLLTLLLLGLAVAPMTSIGNGSRDHDWSGDSATLHALAALLWVGSAIAVRGLGPVAQRRHRRTATAALVVIVGSAVVPTALAVRPEHLVTTGYGALILFSTATLVLLLRRTRSLVVELVLLGVAAAAGAAMSRLVPPTDDGAEVTRLVFLLGYELPDHLTARDLVTRWRPDLIYAPLAVAAAVIYVIGVRRTGSWPVHRTVCWLAGCAVLLAATSSGIGTYATGVLSVHLVAHALTATIAPLLLVLGHPLTLLRAAAPRLGRRVDALLDRPALTHPAVAWAVVAMALFGTYAIGLFDAVVLDHWSHPAMDAVGLGTGLLLFRVLLGHGGLPEIGRLATAFAVMALHAGFAIWLLSRATPLAQDFFAAVALPFVSDLLADQRLGAALSWAIGEAGMVAAVAVLVTRWARHDLASLAPTPDMERL